VIEISSDISNFLSQASLEWIHEWSMEFQLSILHLHPVG
jgi:hypothetical protein